MGGRTREMRKKTGAEPWRQRDLFPQRGGSRKGAGRPCKPGRASEKHQKRKRLAHRFPVHVNIRVERAVGQLRRRRAYQAFRRALQTSLARTDFRVVHISLQREHVHLIVEADHEMALARGMQGLQIAAARYLNAAVSAERGVKRIGRVFVDRYHARILETPTDVRNVIGYVLNNWRHHCEDKGFASMFWEIDPFSTARSFAGWKNLNDPDTPQDELDGLGPLPVANPRTWLLEIGWKQKGGGLLRVDHVPGGVSE
jgi:REP element-mobilizing transposase RayT